jgi:pyruvate,orthophosphate dikinase
MAQKRVYFFGSGKAEGNATMKELLGGKGANLAEMTSLGVPVPPGFTIATKVCGLQRILQNRRQMAKRPGQRG